MDLRLDHRIDTQRPRHQILVLRVARFLGRNHAAVDLLLQQRMIAGDAWNSPPRRRYSRESPMCATVIMLS
jgi:hypothetical protein